MFPLSKEIKHSKKYKAELWLPLGLGSNRQKRELKEKIKGSSCSCDKKLNVEKTKDVLYQKTRITSRSLKQGCQTNGPRMN